MNIKNKKYTYDSALLIDDSVLDNFINEKMVEINFFAKKIYVCTSGSSAIEFINNLGIIERSGDKRYPSIIFIDLNMPNMDGFAFIENFKKINIENLKKTKIVMLTSSVNSEDKKRVEGIEGSVTFVNKPLTKAILDAL